MRKLCTLVIQLASASFFIVSSAFAQWQVPDHAVPIGRGAGTGFKSAAPGTTGWPLVSNGATLDPSFQQVPVAGIGGLGAGVATWLGTPSSANLAAAVTDETGTGALVFANSPVFATPNLGTPSAVNLANATNLPIAAIAGLGSGIGTWLATPSSANLLAALTTKTGTGLAVFSDSPALTGTPTTPTPAASDNSTKIATTAYADNQINVFATARSVLTGCGLAGGGNLSADRTLSANEAINAQTGTSYTYLQSDCGKLVTFSNAASQAVTLPQAGSGGNFASGWFIDTSSLGAGTVTITPTTSTIDGAANLTLSQNDGLRIVSNGTNYFTVRGRSSGAGGAVSSVFGRTGAVVAASSDYTAAQVSRTAPGAGAVASNVDTRLSTEIQLIDFWTAAADDASAFQAAIDYAETIPGGGTVTFCKNPASSHWRLATPITIQTQKVHLKGCGTGSLIILDGTGKIIIGGDTSNITYHSGISNFTIAVTTGGTWTANETVLLQNTSRAFVRDINWFGWSRVAITNGLTTANSSASGSQFSNLVGVAADANCTHAFRFSSGQNSGDIAINNVSFNGCAGTGGALFSFGGTGVAQLDGFYAGNFLGTSFDYGVLAAIETGGGLYTATFANGVFDSGLTANGNVYFAQAAGTVQNITFTGVNFAGSAVAGSNIHLLTSGGTIEAVSITGNTMYDSAVHGIHLEQSSSGVMRGITITGNAIKDGSRTTTNTGDAIIAAGNISSLVISSNTILNNAGNNWRYGVNLNGLNSANTPSVISNNIANVGTAAFNLATAQERMSGITGNIGTVSGADGGNPQLPQAWAIYTSNTPTLLDSYNITSLTKNATGDVTITLANAVAGSIAGISCTGVDVQPYLAAAPASNTARVRTATVGTATLQDTHVSCSFYGRRAN